MSHTDLTINFAFSWHFYVILYLIVGVFAIINLAVFLGYHRLVVRTKDGRPFTKFKFFSYISLVHVPAIYGLMLAFIPLLIGNFFISAFVVAHVWNTQTPLYPCNDPTGNMQCVMTLFDNILDFPGDVNVVYPNLRVGRCGTSMLVMGAYLLYIGISILIPQQDDEVRSLT